MSLHSKNALLKLKEYFNTDTSLNTIYEEMVSFLAHEEQQQEVNQQHQFDLESRQKDLLLTYSLRYLEYKNNLKRASKGVEHKFNIITQEEKNYLRQSLKTLQNKSQKEIEQLERKIHELKTRYEEQKSQLDASLNKEKATLFKTMSETKRQHQEEVQVKASEHALELTQLHVTYEKKHLLLEQKKVKSIESYEALLQEKTRLREQESKSHDNDYINIKLHYSQLNKALNEAIFSFQKQRASILDQVENSHQNKVKPILKEMNDTDNVTEEKIANLEKEYSKTKSLLLKKKEDMFESYESQKNKLVQQMSGSISNLNSKLSNFKESIQTQKSDIQKQYFTDLKEGKPVNLAKRNGELADLDQELNRQILLTKRDVSIKKNQGYQAIFKHEQHYIKDNASLDHELKLLKHTFDFDVKHLLLTATLHKKHLQDKIRRHELDKKFIIDQLQMMHDHEVKKLQIQIDMASHTQERDLSQLTQDALIEVSYLDIEMTQFSLKHQLELLDFEHKKNLFELQQAHDLNLLELKHNRMLEALSMTRDHDLSTLESRIMLSEKLRERGLNEAKLQFDSTYYELSKNIQLIEQLLIHDTKLLELNQLIRQSRFEMYVTRHKIKSDFLLKKEYFFRQQNIHHYYFESFNLIIRSLIRQQIDELKWYQFINHMLKQLYQVPAHPEILRVFFDFVLESLNESQQHTSTIDQLTLQFETLYQSLTHDFYDNLKTYRILDLKQSKHHALKKFDLEKKVIQDKLDAIEFELKQLSGKQSQDQDKLSLKMSQFDQHYQALLKEKVIIDQQLLKEEKTYNQHILTLEKSFHTNLEHSLKAIKPIIHLFEKTHQAHHQFTKGLMSQFQKFKKSLYISESLLTTTLHTISKHEDGFQHQLETIMETLFVHSKAMKDTFLNEIHLESTLKSTFFLTEIKKVQDHVTAIQFKNQDASKELQRLKAILSEQASADIKKSASSLKQKHDTQLDKLSSDIKALEHKVQHALSSLTTSMDYHTLNTKELVTSLEKDFDKQNVVLDESLNKKVLKINEKMTLEAKSHSMMVVNTENKIQSMLMKHHVYTQKVHEQLKNERTNFILNLSKYQKLHKQKLKHSKIRTSKLLKQMSEEKKTLEQQMSLVERRHTKRHQKILIKKQQELQMSYRFKLKMLHID
jgi:golgin subfamily A member 4